MRALAHGLVPMPPVVPQAVPVGQKLAPVQPARRVVPKKENGGADLEAEDRRARGEDRAEDRGGLCDFEV